MTWYRASGGGIPQSVNDMKTLSTTSGAIASFNTDLTDDLISCIIGIPADASGYSSLNISATGKNLYDKQFYLNAYITGSNTITSLANAATIICRCKPNTGYTVSKTAGTRFTVAYTDEYPAIGDSCLGRTQSNTASEISITTGANAQYIIAFVFNPATDSGTINDMLNSVQVEEGEFATIYESFGNTYTVLLGETLTQGGSFNVTTGLLTRTDETTKQLDSNQINTLSGLNQVYADAGNTSVTYLETVGHKIS